MTQHTKIRDAGSILTHDLSILYESGGIPLLLDFKRDKFFIFPTYTTSPQRNDRAVNFIEGMENCGADVPLAENGKQTASSMELFHHVTALPDYYPSKADVKIHADNLDYFTQRMRGGALVEVCIGDARTKTIPLLEKMPRADRPTKIYLNDIHADNLTSSFAAFRELGYRKANIVKIKGDVREPDVWNQINEGLAADKARKVTVLMQGATFNDFSIDEMKGILGYLHTMPSKTMFLFSIDNTTDVQTLQKAYDNHALRQLALAGVENYRYMPVDGPLGVKPFEPARAKSLVTIGKDGPYTDITLSVEDPTYYDRFTPIRKIPMKPEMAHMLSEAKTQLLRRMPFNDPVRFPKVKYAFYALRAKPRARQP